MLFNRTFINDVRFKSQTTNHMTDDDMIIL